MTLVLSLSGGWYREFIFREFVSLVHIPLFGPLRRYQMISSLRSPHHLVTSSPPLFAFIRCPPLEEFGGNPTSYMVALFSIFASLLHLFPRPVFAVICDCDYSIRRGGCRLRLDEGSDSAPCAHSPPRRFLGLICLWFVRRVSQLAISFGYLYTRSPLLYSGAISPVLHVPPFGLWSIPGDHYII